MSILKNLGFFGASINRRGVKEALIQTFRAIPNASEARLGGAKPFDFYNRSSPAPAEVPEIPTTPGTYDMGAFLRTAQRDTSDLTASITCILIPLKNLFANISAWASTNYSVGGYITGSAQSSWDMYAMVSGLQAGHTLPLSYDYSILSTPSGVSIIRRQLTKIPDLYATIAGWDYLDIWATVKAINRGETDLFAIVGSVTPGTSDLLATIISTYIEDITASILSIPPVDLNASLQTIPPEDLPAYLLSIPPADLPAFGGGHFPEDITASMLTNHPVPIIAWIRAGYSSTSDVTAAITSIGGWSNINAIVKAFSTDTKKLKASITPRIVSDILGFIHGRQQSDLTASIEGVYTSDIGGYVRSWRVELFSDMLAFARVQQRASKDLVTSANGVFSNYLDMGGTITGDVYPILDLYASIRGALPVFSDIGASLRSVTSAIKINKVPINFVNLSELSVYISAFSGYNPMSASVTGWVRASTGTSSDAAWVYVSSSIKFYLGLDKGLYIPQRITRAVKPGWFTNTSKTPDLWSYVYGWAVSDISASISVQPYSRLSASVTSQDLSHVKTLSALLQPFHISGISASISSIGGYSGIQATIASLGQASTLTASIVPYLMVLGYRVIPVETKPFLDMRAVVNPISSCGYNSSYSNIKSFVRAATRPELGSNITAYINSLSNIIDIGASIIGRKITRLKTFNLMFRALTRFSSPITSLVIGIGQSISNLSSYIKAMPHEQDISASITVYRPLFAPTEDIGTIDIYKLVNANATLYKQLSLTFSSKAEEYVYDGINNSLYTIGDGRWAINISELSETGTFFDRDPEDRNRILDSIVEYNSVDEAIRGALQLLIEMRRNDLTASITATGGYSGIRADIEGIPADRVNDLPASVYLVFNQPTLTASISAYSGYGPLSALVTGFAQSSPDLYASLRTVIYDAIGATITGIT